jgi:hypothetical protein
MKLTWASSEEANVKEQDRRQHEERLEESVFISTMKSNRRARQPNKFNNEHDNEKHARL